MTRRIGVAGVAMLLAGSVALADFTYEQTSKMTGGAMMGMVRVMGAFSKQMREPMKSTIAVKGDRMMIVTEQATQVLDLSKETITEMNHQKKQYSVATFAEWAAALENMKLRDEKGKEQASASLKGVKVDQPGDTRQVNGITARHSIVTMEFEGANDKGEKATIMTMVADMWLAPDVAGYAEVKNFYQRMGQKLAWSPNSSFLSAAAPGSSKGMAEVIKESSKLDGVPVIQVTRMMFGTPEQAAAMARQQQAQQQQEQQQTIEAEKPTAGGTLGKLGGRLGGFGGFGRKKNQQEQPAQSAPARSEQQAGGGAPGSLMELTSELSGFSSGAVDASKFDVPAGYKQVESETLKSMKRR